MSSKKNTKKNTGNSHGTPKFSAPLAKTAKQAELEKISPVEDKNPVEVQPKKKSVVEVETAKPATLEDVIQAETVKTATLEDSVVEADIPATVKKEKIETEKEEKTMIKKEEKSTAPEKKTVVKETPVKEEKATAKKEVAAEDKKAAKKEVIAEDKKAAKKAPAPAKEDKKTVVQNLYIQHNDTDFEYKDIFKRVKEAWIALGNKESDIKSVNVYVVPSHMRVYYVINEEAKEEYSFDL
jgi:hypothetical protein